MFNEMIRKAASYGNSYPTLKRENPEEHNLELTIIKASRLMNKIVSMIAVAVRMSFRQQIAATRVS